MRMLKMKYGRKVKNILEKVRTMQRLLEKLIIINIIYENILQNYALYNIIQL
jgi:hypothetical protein